MNYERIYNNLCELCKTTDVKDRLSNRNANDERLSVDYIYTEKHHIVPRHDGGKDLESNLVVMLPEEHYMAHLLRFKAYNNRNDFLAIRLMVNGYVYKKKVSSVLSSKLKNKLVASFKQNVSMFRKQNTWHSPVGVKNISEARKGTMPVIDSETLEMIGSVDVNHPNVLSGKWRHHSTGNISVTCKTTGVKKYITVNEYKDNYDEYTANIGDAKGDNNPRFSGFSDDELVNIVSEFSVEMGLGFLFPYRMVANHYRKIKKYEKLPKSFSSFRFNGLGSKELHRLASEKTGLVLNVYYNNNLKTRKEIKNKNITIC
jgi:hypothetical protein